MGEGKILSSEEIHRRLDNISARIGKEETSILHTELDEIFMYKPVDFHYFLVRGQVYFYEERYDDVYLAIAAKENWWVPSPYALMIIELLYETGKRYGAYSNAKNLKILGYFIYKDSITGCNRGRKIYYNENFVLDAKKEYFGVLLKKEQLVEELLDIGFDEKEFIQKGEKLYDCYYNLNQILPYTIVMTAYLSYANLYKSDNYSFFVNEVVGREPNINFFIKEMLDNSRQKDKFIFMILDDKQRKEFLVLAKYLRSIGRECILFEQPVKIELDYMIEIEDTVEISITNQEEQNGIRIIYPCILFLNGKCVGNNISKLVNFFLIQEDDEFINIVGNRDVFTEQNFFCLTEYKRHFSEYEVCFGYAGNYTSYISRIFGYDYSKALNCKEECLFSIVIPVRNSAYTLQYTLQTCLEQRGIEKSKYEIVISDNSNRDSSEIENLIKNIDDERIKYFKTPYDLPLAKSFEFAYGLTRGKYILAIGADDGLLPWALEVLSELVEKYPKEEVIGWERGFFQWTESQDAQRGKFDIPRFYKKGEYNEIILNGLAALKQRIDSDAETIYTMPLLYINSLFKRSFLLQLLEQTGTIINGYTQDYSMGIKSMLFCKNYVYAQYPITVAGMSDNSLGSKMVKLVIDDSADIERLQKETERGVGNAVIESEFPFWTNSSITGMFWAELFKLRKVPLCDIKIKLLLEEHDWKKTFESLSFKQNMRDINFFPKLEKTRISAYCCGEEVGHWYDQKIYEPMLYYMNRWVLEDVQEEKYKTGFIDSEGLTLDAARFDVMNIEEAVQLFSDIVNL